MTTNPPFVPTAVAGAAHAFLAPSSASRWVVCPGSARMEAAHPEAGDKPEAADGTAAHWCAQQMHDGWAPSLLLTDGKTETGHPIDAEMVEAAELYYGDIKATLAAHGLPVSAAILEQRVRIGRVHPTLNWGTPDARAWVTLNPAQRILYVWDFKYGHKFVDVYENWQLVDYAAGILEEAGVPEDDTTTQIVFRIVQPRSYHRDGPVREWRTTPAELRALVWRLHMAAEDATSPTAECKPAPDACENCTARHACEALQRAAYRGMDLAAQAQAEALSPAALGLELRYLTDAAKLMEARITGLQAQAESVIRSGARVPHWGMEPAGSRVKWTKSASEVLALGAMMGLDLAKPTEPITPTQAKAKGLPAALLGAYSAAPPGAMRLTIDDGSDARKVFASSR